MPRKLCGSQFQSLHLFQTFQAFGETVCLRLHG